MYRITIITNRKPTATSDTYIEKDLAINDEMNKLRLAAPLPLLPQKRERRGVYRLFRASTVWEILQTSTTMSLKCSKARRFRNRNVFLRRLVDSLYVRNDARPEPWQLPCERRYRGHLSGIRRQSVAHYFWGDEIDSIEEVDPISGVTVGKFDAYKIYPANLFMTTKEAALRAIHEIEDDLHKQVQWFESEGRTFSKRLQERVTYDMEMIRELGHCSGIENYSLLYWAGRRYSPYCLLDFAFPEDFLIVIDKSHVGVHQIRAMYGGDRARKENLVEYGLEAACC